MPGEYQPQFDREFAPMTHNADYCNYYADASGRQVVEAHVHDHVSLLEAMRNESVNCALITQDIIFPQDYFEPESDYWTGLGDGTCQRSSVPLCPYQFITSLVIAPSRDLPGRVKLALPRLPTIGNDMAILDNRADEPLSYIIAAGVDVYHLMDIRLAKNIRLNMLGNSFFFANTYFQNPFFAFHDTTIYGDCGGVSSSIPIVCASLSRRVSPSRGCGTPWSWPCTNGALSIANHCHMSRLDSLTVVDYMVVAYNSTLDTGRIIEEELPGWWKNLYMGNDILFSVFNSTSRCCEAVCTSPEDCKDLACLPPSPQCSPAQQLCVDADDAYSFEHRNRHYYLMPTATTHAAAQAHCASGGGALASFDNVAAFQRVAYGLLSSDGGFDIRKSVTDMQAHVASLNSLGDAQENTIAQGMVWVDGAQNADGEWVNSGGASSFFQWWSANGSITDSYLRHQPTPRPLTPLCVGLESIYVFNTPVNCSRLFPSLCMTESDVSTTTPDAMPPSGLAATRGNDEASTLFTVMMFVGSALLVVLLTMLVLYRRGRDARIMRERKRLHGDPDACCPPSPERG